MTKVKLPREIVEAIDHLRTITSTNRDLYRTVECVEINPVARKVYKWAFAKSGAGTPDLLMEALVNGYQVEETPKLPIVTPEHFGALNLLAYHYNVLGGLLAEYSTAELDDLVNNGYRTKGER